MIGKINTQKLHFYFDEQISPMGAFLGSFEACLATVMEVNILFLHKVVQNSPKYPLLKGNVDNSIRSIDKFLTGKPLQH